MDLEFLIPCILYIPVSLMFINLNTSSYMGLYKEERGFDFKGNPCRETNLLHPDYPRHHHYPSHHPQPVTTSNIPIKQLSFIGISTYSVNSFTHFSPFSSSHSYKLMCCFFFSCLFYHSTTAVSAFPAMAMFEVRYIFVIVIFMVECVQTTTGVLCVIYRVLEKGSDCPH